MEPAPIILSNSFGAVYIQFEVLKDVRSQYTCIAGFHVMRHGNKCTIDRSGQFVVGVAVAVAARICEGRYGVPPDQN